MKKTVFGSIAFFCVMSGAVYSADFDEKGSSGLWAFFTKERSAVDPVSGKSVQRTQNEGICRCLTKERGAVDPVTGKAVAEKR